MNGSAREIVRSAHYSTACAASHDRKSRQLCRNFIDARASLSSSPFSAPCMPPPNPNPRRTLELLVLVLQINCSEQGFDTSSSSPLSRIAGSEHVIRHAMAFTVRASQQTGRTFSDFVRELLLDEGDPGPAWVYDGRVFEWGFLLQEAVSHHKTLHE